MTRGRFGLHARLSSLTVVAVLAVIAASGCGSSTRPPVRSEATKGPPASTSPVPSEQPAPSQQPAAGLQLGFSAGELVGLSPGELSDALDSYQAAGGSVIRFDINWARVQPDGPNDWDWSGTDVVVDALAARQLTALPILDYTPSWARPDGCTSELCEPANPDAFATFAAAAANRYAVRGVTKWEVWNEQNTRWLPAPNAATYGQLLQKSSAALHRVDPQATVLVGGLAPAQTVSGGSYSPPDFVTALYTLGFGSAFDGVAVHPYSFPSLPGEAARGSGWEQMLEVRNVMVGHDDSGKGVWATEFGAPTAGPGAIATYTDRRYSSQPDHVDLDLQARMVEQAVTQGRRLPWLRVLLWYGLDDLGSDPGTSLMSFGLRSSDGAPKPAYAAWQAAVRSLAG
jgi:hypothetical protein